MRKPILSEQTTVRVIVPTPHLPDGVSSGDLGTIAGHLGVNPQPWPLDAADAYPPGTVQLYWVTFPQRFGTLVVPFCDEDIEPVD